MLCKPVCLYILFCFEDKCKTLISRAFVLLLINNYFASGKEIMNFMVGFVC